MSRIFRSLLTFAIISIVHCEFRAGDAPHSQAPHSQALTIVSVSCASGTAHIILSDGSHVHPDKLKDQAGCSKPLVGPDRQTAGWTVDYDVGGQSYPVPLVLPIYSQGKVLEQFRPGLVIWGWQFWKGSEQVALAWGPTHTGIIGYQLYDVKSGRLVIDAGACHYKQPPSWARGLCGHTDCTVYPTVP